MRPERSAPSGPAARAGHTERAAPYLPNADPGRLSPYVPLISPPNPTVPPGSWKHP